jgi:hypothetical protein
MDTNIFKKKIRMRERRIERKGQTEEIFIEI